ncbi:MAG: protease [Bdellovibrionales bacterium]
MKSKLAFTALILLSFGCLASEFDEGAPEYDQKPVANRTDADIQKAIQNEMAIACSGNLCKIVGADNQGSSWTVSFSVGYGSSPNSGSGDTIYIGDQSANNNERGYAGVTVTYKNYVCHSTLKVSPAVYQFVNTYMYNMINHDSSTKRNFSPAEQTVVLFYTTMLNKVENCKNASL